MDAEIGVDPDQVGVEGRVMELCSRQAIRYDWLASCSWSSPRFPGWRHEDPDELLAAWVLTPDPERILRLCWVQDEFRVVSNTVVSSVMPLPSPEPWQKNMLALVGFCDVHDVQYHYIAEWPGIEGMRDLVKDC